MASAGLDAAIERCQKYIEAGADVIFAEAITDPDEYRRFTGSLDAPVLANMTEFGMSPLMTVDELREVGVEMVLYPLSAFRAMSQIANTVYESIRAAGTQQNVVEQMQSRDDLYAVLDYHHYEQQIDRILKKAK